jgi:hypothetical protein
MPEPVIRCVLPESDADQQRWVVTIAGSNLATVSGVWMGERRIAPADLVIADDQYLAATWSVPTNGPWPVPGPVDVVVENPDGLATLRDGFTYVPRPPAVSSVAPFSGPATGGTAVRIGGRYLANASEVTFAGAPAEIIDATHDAIRCITPPGTPEFYPVQVWVTTPEGRAQSTTGFTYSSFPAGPPQFQVQPPNFGPVVGGYQIRLGGPGARGLSGATEVTFGGLPAEFTIEWDELILATVPRGPAGIVLVTVATPAGTGTAGFEWLAVC